MSQDELPALNADIRTLWQRLLDQCEGLRPQLYRYCRHLTKTPWDAEDLVQDTLARAFVNLGTAFHPIENPRAWLFRIASNLWIDRVRHLRLARLQVASTPIEAPSQMVSMDPRLPREAAGTLIAALSPQERVAVLLKDVFAFSLEEVAHTLNTTSGAVKAALHRGRSRLDEVTESFERAPAPQALDAFCEAFTARDLERLAALLLDSSIVEIVGVVTEYGQQQPKDSDTGSFAGMLSPITSSEQGGVADEHLRGYHGGLPRATVRAYRDGWVLLLWYPHGDEPHGDEPHGDEEAVRTVMTVECEGERLCRVRNYFFSPDVIAEVCRELDVPFRCNGYRYWV